ncbi:MAG: hypothetical protein II657_00235, partial [Clostridiales bacterium]|nr:hypothetical protein [Clostridiales bacterium]
TYLEMYLHIFSAALVTRPICFCRSHPSKAGIIPLDNCEISSKTDFRSRLIIVLISLKKALNESK